MPHSNRAAGSGGARPTNFAARSAGPTRQEAAVAELDRQRRRENAGPAAAARAPADCLWHSLAAGPAWDRHRRRVRSWKLGASGTWPGPAGWPHRFDGSGAAGVSARCGRSGQGRRRVVSGAVCRSPRDIARFECGFVGRLELVYFSVIAAECPPVLFRQTCSSAGFWIDCGRSTVDVERLGFRAFQVLVSQGGALNPRPVVIPGRAARPRRQSRLACGARALELFLFRVP